MKRKRLCTAILTVMSLLLASCSSTTLSVKPIERPVTFRVKCLPLPELPQGRVTMGELYNHDNVVVQQYGECAARHNSEPDVIVDGGK